MRATTAAVALAVSLVALPAAAQNRAAQAATGSALVGLGAWAAFADRDCPGRLRFGTDGCYQLVGDDRLRWIEDHELPKLQVAGGLVASGIGGAMAAGVWAPSRDLDTIALALAGAGLIAGSFDYRDAPGTVHGDFGGRRYSACVRGNTVTDRCTDASLARRSMMWAGFGSLGLAAVRWFWGDGTTRLDIGAGRRAGQQDDRILTPALGRRVRQWADGGENGPVRRLRRHDHQARHAGQAADPRQDPVLPEVWLCSAVGRDRRDHPQGPRLRPLRYLRRGSEAHSGRRRGDGRHRRTT